MSARFPRNEHFPHFRAFTLVEMMVASVILSVILLLVFSITQQTGDAWKNSAAKIEYFQGARAAFETMTRRISRATLNTYYDYFDSNFKRRADYAGDAAALGSFLPYRYGRHSDLHFISGKSIAPNQITHSVFFQAPTGYSGEDDYKGLDAALNATGYFVEYAKDNYKPTFLNAQPKYRYRLMQMTQPTEQLSIFSSSSDPRGWFTGPLGKSTDPYSANPRPVYEVAENIVALIVHPKRSEREIAAGLPELTTDFEYDSRTTQSWGATARQPLTQHQLPPLLEIILVAVDEQSFVRLNAAGTSADLGQSAWFKTTAALESDLKEFTDKLSDPTLKLKYQIFRSEVPIRSAKWSE